MLTGQRPYNGQSAMSIAVHHTNSRVHAPSSIVPGISAAVDDIVLHMTEPAPEDRPADATEVLILIEHLLENPDTAEQLAEQHHSEKAATEVFSSFSTKVYDPDETVAIKADEAPNGSEASQNHRLRPSLTSQYCHRL